jgi:hypothetical protein
MDSAITNTPRPALSLNRQPAAQGAAPDLRICAKGWRPLPSQFAAGGWAAPRVARPPYTNALLGSARQPAIGP